MGYWKLFKSEPRPLIFGILNGFFSGLGQTHLVSLFGPAIMLQFQFSNTQFGSLYSLATLASAFILPFIGPLIDRVDIRYFCLFLGLGMAFCELLIANTSSIYFVFASLLGLRLFGQGLATQLGSTSIARYFHQNRGKALSLSNLGFPLAEGLLTPFVAFAMTFLSWPSIALGLAGFCLFIYVPLSLSLTRNIPHFNKPEPQQLSTSSDLSSSKQKQWTRSEVFKHRGIYCLLPHTMMPAFSLTGLIFHQAAVAQLKGWSLSTIAGGLLFFALFRISLGFVIGPQVDRFSAAKLFPFHLLFLILGFSSLAFFKGSFTPALAFSFFGMAVGCGSSIKSALWAELYGTKYLGAIKSTLATVMVFSTAVSPFLFGWYLDQYAEVQLLLYGLSALTIFISLVSWFELEKGSLSSSAPLP